MALTAPAVRRFSISLGVLLALTAIVAGCGGGGDAKIALLLPENETPRYESEDKPDFERAVEEECEDCEVLYSNAGGDAEKQQSQAEAALTQGADVLVVDPVDPRSAAAIADKAKAEGVPVLSYDRLIENAEVDHYVSYDKVGIGELQAETLWRRLVKLGNATFPILVLNGDRGDGDAALIKEGALEAFEVKGVPILREYDTPNWSASNARREVEQTIATTSDRDFGAVYTANDDIASGAIAAMKPVGIYLPARPTTGQDATVAGLRRILAREQYMTVYKPVEPEATIAAEVAVALAEGDDLPEERTGEKVDNGETGVPSTLLEAVAVNRAAIKDTVIKDGFVSPAELCTKAYAEACREMGIS
ncbi:MAG TPA: substrate-binding domain-containing protein [Solirubrobacterales bacterium]